MSVFSSVSVVGFHVLVYFCTAKWGNYNEYDVFKKNMLSSDMRTAIFVME